MPPGKVLSIRFLRDGPDNAGVTVALAHGAGAPMDSPFMDTFAAALARWGIAVARFEFPYMARRREDGRRRPPDRAETLIATWLEVSEALAPKPLVVGGKSMGGRIATLIADRIGAIGLICVGYPFHPPGRPEKLRVEHLASLRTPTLILQGERDRLGILEEVAGYTLSPAIRVEWLLDGDHDLTPRAAAERTHGENIEAAAQLSASFIGGLDAAG